MNLVTGIFLAVLLVVCAGLSLHLLREGRRQGCAQFTPSPWIIFAARLTMLAAGAAAIWMLHSARVFAIVAVTFFFTFLNEVARRPRDSAGSKPPG